MTKPAIKLLKPFTRWSYSAWSTWKGCAYRFGKVYYEGLKSPASPAAARGTMIHSQSENFIKGEIYGLPPALKKLRTHYTELMRYKKRIITEQFWGVTPKWKPSKDENKSWCVMRMDTAILPTKKDPVLTIIDLKTGREYDGHYDQGSLYATIGYALYPTIDEVHVEFWYADSKDKEPTSSWTYTPAMLKKSIVYWDEQGRKMFEEKKFMKTPSVNTCRWCHLRSDKGGPCSAWKQA